MTATIDASTKAVDIDESKVVCTWEVGDTVALVYNNTRISVLDVISVDGNKAQLSGKLKGSYNEGTQMHLYYGGTSYDYSDQTGTEASAVSKAYLKADTEIQSVSPDGKTLTLMSVALVHQQSYMGLSFYMGSVPVKVKSVEVTGGGSNIVKTHPLGGSETIYDTEKFIVTAPTEAGQEVFYFALRDNSTVENNKYKLEISCGDQKYYGEVKAPAQGGNHFEFSKVLLGGVWQSPVITAPTVHAYIEYDGLPHNLVTPAVVQPGATVYYCVSPDMNTKPDQWSWSTTIPSATSLGNYPVWYKVVSGDSNYEDILATKVGIASIINAYPTTP